MYLTLAACQRVLRGSATPVARVQFQDQDGDVAGELSGSPAVTATVKNLDGETVGTADRVAAWNDPYYTVELTTDEAADLAVYEVEWSVTGSYRTSTWVRVVGGFLFSVTDLTARPSIGSAYNDQDKLLAREWATNLVEHQTGSAWAPRLDRVKRYQPYHSKRLVLPTLYLTRVVAVTVDGTSEPVSSFDVDQSGGVVYGDFYGDVTVDFEHGTRTVPEPLRMAGLVAAADLLTRNTSGLSQRTRSHTNEQGTVQTLSWPGPGHPTGLDFVDAAIATHTYDAAGVA